MLVVVAQSGSCCWLCQPCRFLEPGNWPTTTGGKESRLNPIDPRCSVLSNTFRLFFSFFVCLPPFFPPSPVFFFLFSWRSGAAFSLMGQSAAAGRFLDPPIQNEIMLEDIRTRFVRLRVKHLDHRQLTSRWERHLQINQTQKHYVSC